MGTAVIETVVFDLGGVLVDWNPRYLYRKLLDSESEIEWFLANVCTDDWNRSQDEGRPISEANRLLMEKHPEHAELIEAYYGRWLEMIGGPIHATVDLLQQLRANDTRVLFLSNWSAETFPLARERLEFLSWFEGGVLSGVERLVKPDVRIYQLLLERYRVNPRTAIYVDDREENLSPAQSLGMTVHHFQDANRFGQALRDANVLRR